MKKSLLFMLLIGFSLTGCGIKPNNLKPEDSSKVDEFPRAYPDIKTDPKPETMMRRL